MGNLGDQRAEGGTSVIAKIGASKESLEAPGEIELSMLKR
jgi:hypothetical protein